MKILIAKEGRLYYGGMAYRGEVVLRSIKNN